MEKHNYKVLKTVIQPYYKYKQDAYKKLKELVVQVLDEYGYFEMTGRSKALRGLYFGNDVVGVPGAVYVYLSDGSCVLSIIGNRVAGGLGVRDRLTYQEDEIISKNLALLFKDKGARTVSDVLQSQTGYWLVTKDYCEFVGASGIHYLNQD